MVTTSDSVYMKQNRSSHASDVISIVDLVDRVFLPREEHDIRDADRSIKHSRPLQEIISYQEKSQAYRKFQHCHHQQEKEIQAKPVMVILSVLQGQQGCGGREELRECHWRGPDSEPFSCWGEKETRWTVEEATAEPRWVFWAVRWARAHWAHARVEHAVCGRVHCSSSSSSSSIESLVGFKWRSGKQKLGDLFMDLR